MVLPFCFSSLPTIISCPLCSENCNIYQLQEGTYIECDRSPIFPWIEKIYLYNFLEEAQQDEIAAEVNLRTLVKEMRTDLK